MGTGLYRLILVSSKETPTWFHETFVRNKFMDLYNKAREVLNSNYENWNAAYDEIKDQRNYDDYICEKQNALLKEIKDPVFEVFTDPEISECGIAIRCKAIPSWYTTMYLKEV